MKFILLVLILLLSSNASSAETYQQCKKRVLKEIAQYEKRTGNTVTEENKRLSVQAYCTSR